MKLEFFNSKLIGLYLKIASALLAIESFVLIFVTMESSKVKIGVLLFSVIGYCVMYVALYFGVRNKSEKIIKIRNNNIIVKFGDIFEEKGLKVIASNEYFDSKVDDVLISSKTLHGKVIKEYIENVADMDQKLADDVCCNSKIIEDDTNRSIGKTKKYELGTCFKYDKFIFVAFTKFDKENRAYLELPNYLYCLSNMWNEINRVYDGNNVVLPLVGSGITRLNGFSTIQKQEQLELLIDSLKYSNLTFSHDVSITIVLPENLKNELSLFKL